MKSLTCLVVLMALGCVFAYDVKEDSLRALLEELRGELKVRELKKALETMEEERGVYCGGTFCAQGEQCVTANGGKKVCWDT
ncbi:uncharacterized protein LOC119726619 isoform X2 [Patiria miniata]|uniref:Uncharacterized protein n=1 Tax=Patiria miniata TaxID=46514 RepID=A0A913ZSY6_PATMI|nr:uncharacterized protein LOC119726619 isoform X2 [Patiria miniata]XP_038054300.1 uncharacterized protein LOC119726619 isoform X2 [Patiria miniata]